MARLGRGPRKLLERFDVHYDLDNFDGLLKKLQDIKSKYPNKLIEIDYDLNGCRGHGPDEYCYCTSPYIDVNVYDVDVKK